LGLVSFGSIVSDLSFVDNCKAGPSTMPAAGCSAYGDAETNECSRAPKASAVVVI
jgi:hypothetical protein